MSLLANILTTLSLTCGFFSIILSLEGHYSFASWAILFSVLFDGFDGQFARRNHALSAFGKEFDSLVDVISFGIAPAILGYSFVYHDFHALAIIVLFFFLFCSVVRLARFNILPKESLVKSFIGFPTTASGGLLACLVLIYRRYASMPPSVLFLMIVLILSFLMVSKIKYANLDGLTDVFRASVSIHLIIIAVVSFAFLGFYLATAVLLPEIMILTLFIIYVFSPLFFKKFV